MYRITLTVACAAITTLSLVSTAQAAPATTGSLTNPSSAAQVDSYWTPQRLAAAKPMPAPVTAGVTKAVQTTDGPERIVAATTPSGISPASTESTEASVWTTVGRLVFTVPGKGDYICTATVVTSNNHDVISTGRHCVVDVSTWTAYSNFRFAPAYNNGSTPYGWWTWRAAGWRTDDTGPGGDNAFIVLNTGGNSNTHVQNAIGSTGIAFNSGLAGYAHGLGIPGSTNYAVWCEGVPYIGPSGGVQIANCNGLSGGASGGPFVVDYQSDGNATQTASYFGSWGDAYWAYYRTAAYDVYNGAQNR